MKRRSEILRHRTLTTGLVVFASLCVLSAVPGTASAVPSEIVSEVFSSAREAVVLVTYSTRVAMGDVRSGQQAFRPGVIVSEEGLVMIPGHAAIADRVPFNIRVQTEAGREYDAQLLGKDPSINIVFIQIDNPEGEAFPFLEFEENPQVSIGDDVIAVGLLPRTLNYERTFRVARVNGMSENPRPVYTTDLPAPLPPGYWGAPVINAEGKGVGVVGFELSDRDGGILYRRHGYPLLFTSDLFYSLIENPPKEVLNEAEDISAMGVYTQPLTEDLARYWGLEKPGGIIISTVVAQSPAEKAGLRQGDVIVTFDGEPITATEDSEVLDFTKMVQEKEIGSEVDVSVIRIAQREREEGELGPAWEAEQLTIPLLMEKRPKSALQADMYENEQFGVTVREITLDVVFSQNLDPETQGVVVHRIESGGWSALGGLRRGDLVTKVGNFDVQSLDDFQKALELAAQVKPPNVYLVIIRGGRNVFIRVQTAW